MHLQANFEVSERRACQLVGQNRSSQRYQARLQGKDKSLVAAIHDLARKHPRFGYRRIHALLKADGWNINTKRVYRLWRQAGLKVPKKPRRRRHVGNGDNACDKKKAEHTNHVWAYDFVHERTEKGAPLKILAIVDEFTRECLAIKVETSIKAADVVVTLNNLIEQRGAPLCIRSDNGSEFIAQQVRSFLKQRGVQTLFIEPGAPWQNGYSESFNAKFSDELLKREIFTSMLEARVVCEDWRHWYNQKRPHSALNYSTPAAFAASTSTTDSHRSWTR